jgi:hypothetical protein
MRPPARPPVRYSRPNTPAPPAEAVVLGVNPDGENYRAPISSYRLHSTTIGMSGFGKSRSEELRIRQLITLGYGVCVIDPKGRNRDSIFNNTLRWLKAEGIWQPDPPRSREVRIIDLTSPDFVTSINPLYRLDLDGQEPDPAIAVRPFIDVLERVWNRPLTDTPAIRRYLPSMMIALMEHGLSLVDARHIFTEGGLAPIRLEKLAQTTKNRRAKANLEQLVTYLGVRNPTDYRVNTEGVHNRLDPFLEQRRTEHMFGAAGMPLDLRRIMDDGEILLCNLSPDGINSDDSTKHLIGTWLVREFQRLATLRNNNYYPYFLFIDEADQFLSGDVATILDRCRSEGLSLNMAVHSDAQLQEYGEKIRRAVISQPNTVTVFGGLDTDETTPFANRMFRFPIDQGVEATKRMMPNGKKQIVELHNRSHRDGTGGNKDTSISIGGNVQDTAAVANSEGQVETTADVASVTHATAPLPGPDGTALVTVMEGAATNAAFGRSTNQTHISAHSEGRNWSRAEREGVNWSSDDTEGVSQQMIDELEMQFTTVYSPETLKHAAAELLAHQDRRYCWVSVERQPAVCLFIPDVVSPSVSDQQLADFKRAIFDVDPAAIAVTKAEQNIADREAVIDKVLGVVMPGDPATPVLLDDNKGWRADIDSATDQPADSTFPKFDLQHDDQDDNIVPFPPRKDDDDKA